MSKLDSAEFDRLLTEARAAVASGSEVAVAAAPDITGSATDAAGQVSAEVGVGGRLTSLWIEPDVLALGADVVCARVVEAVNKAQDALRADLRHHRDNGIDPAVLDEQIQQVQQGAVRQLSALLQAMTDALQDTGEADEDDEDD